MVGMRRITPDMKESPRGAQDRPGKRQSCQHATAIQIMGNKSPLLIESINLIASPSNHYQI